MKFRAGAVVGFAVGYFFGARAGRERYVQIRRSLDALPLGALVEKAAALVELAVERVRPGVPADNVVPLRAVGADE
jgi:hypothetical protein